MSNYQSEQQSLSEPQLALVPAAAAHTQPVVNSDCVEWLSWSFMDQALYREAYFAAVLGRYFSNAPRTCTIVCDCERGCINCLPGQMVLKIHNSLRTPRHRGIGIAFDPRPFTHGYQRMGYQRIGYQRLSERVREFPKQDLSGQCIVCFDDVRALELRTQSSRGISCPNKHVVCRTCLDNLIISHCSKVLYTPSTPSSVNCPSCSADHSLGLFLSTKSYGSGCTYSKDQLKNACGGASEKAMELLSSVAAADKELAALPPDEQIRNGNTDCYLCPKCKFGPVAHRACSDLLSHHSHSGVNNSCPACGFLASDISEWIRVSGDALVDLPAAVSPRRVRCGFNPFMRCPSLDRWRDQISREPIRDEWHLVDLRPSRKQMPGVLDQNSDCLWQRSYWDAPIFRMVQQAFLVAISSNSRLAIGNGSEASGAESRLENERIKYSSRHAAASEVDCV